MMFCIQCGSPMQPLWVACPRCGQKYELVKPRDARRPESWRPSRIQWIVIWAAVLLSIMMFGDTNNGSALSIAPLAVGALLICQIQGRRR
jgi:hypothetical protein